jgi:hypothetical protein
MYTEQTVFKLGAASVEVNMAAYGTFNFQLNVFLSKLSFLVVFHVNN